MVSSTDAVHRCSYTVSEATFKNLTISRFFEALPSPASGSRNWQFPIKFYLQDGVFLLSKRPKCLFVH